MTDLPHGSKRLKVAHDKDETEVAYESLEQTQANDNLTSAGSCSISLALTPQILAFDYLKERFSDSLQSPQFLDLRVEPVNIANCGLEVHKQVATLTVPSRVRIEGGPDTELNTTQIHNTAALTWRALPGLHSSLQLNLTQSLANCPHAFVGCPNASDKSMNQVIQDTIRLLLPYICSDPIRTEAPELQVGKVPFVQPLIDLPAMTKDVDGTVKFSAFLPSNRSTKDEHLSRWPYDEDLVSSVATIQGILVDDIRPIQDTDENLSGVRTVQFRPRFRLSSMTFRNPKENQTASMFLAEASSWTSIS